MPSLEPSSVVCHPITYHMYFNLISFIVRDESVINKIILQYYSSFRAMLHTGFWSLVAWGRGTLSGFSFS